MESETIEISLSFLFRRPSGLIRPYAGTGLSILIVDQGVKDRRAEDTGSVTQISSIQSNEVGWHFLGGVKLFHPEGLFPRGFPGRFFLAGEYRYLVANIVAQGKSGFGSLKDQINGQFFMVGLGFQF